MFNAVESTKIYYDIGGGTSVVFFFDHKSFWSGGFDETTVTNMKTEFPLQLCSLTSHQQTTTTSTAACKTCCSHDQGLSASDVSDGSLSSDLGRPGP